MKLYLAFEQKMTGFVHRYNGPIHIQIHIHVVRI